MYWLIFIFKIFFFKKKGLCPKNRWPINEDVWKVFNRHVPDKWTMYIPGMSCSSLQKWNGRLETREREDLRLQFESGDVLLQCFCSKWSMVWIWLLWEGWTISSTTSFLWKMVSWCHSWISPQCYGLVPFFCWVFISHMIDTM